MEGGLVFRQKSAVNVMSVDFLIVDWHSVELLNLLNKQVRKTGFKFEDFDFKIL